MHKGGFSSMVKASLVVCLVLSYGDVLVRYYRLFEDGWSG